MTDNAFCFVGLAGERAVERLRPGPIGPGRWTLTPRHTFQVPMMIRISLWEWHCAPRAVAHRWPPQGREGMGLSLGGGRPGRRDWCPLWVKSRHLQRTRRCPLYPDCDSKSGHRGPDGGRSISALPCTSNVDLLRNREGIVHINAEISDSALYLGVTKQKLDGAQISGAAVNQCRLEEHASCKAMSAFTVAIRCKADMPVCTAYVRL